MATARQQQPPQHGNNGSVNAHLAGSGGSAMGQQQQDEAPRPQQYTIPGILHYIQHEWARFEMERAHWEVERAELQVSDRPTALAYLLTRFTHALAVSVTPGHSFIIFIIIQSFYLPDHFTFLSVK